MFYIYGLGGRKRRSSDVTVRANDVRRRGLARRRRSRRRDGYAPARVAAAAAIYYIYISAGVTGVLTIILPTTGSNTVQFASAVIPGTSTINRARAISVNKPTRVCKKRVGSLVR